MNRLAIFIVPVVLWMTAIESAASLERVDGQERDLFFATPEFFSNACSGPLLWMDMRSTGSNSGPGPEEEDDTKEKVLQKAVRLNHIFFVKQRFALHRDIFKEHQNEIGTPPPQFSVGLFHRLFVYFFTFPLK